MGLNLIWLVFFHLCDQWLPDTGLGPTGTWDLNKSLYLDGQYFFGVLITLILDPDRLFSFVDGYRWIHTVGLIAASLVYAVILMYYFARKNNR